MYYGRTIGRLTWTGQENNGQLLLLLLRSLHAAGPEGQDNGKKFFELSQHFCFISALQKATNSHKSNRHGGHSSFLPFHLLPVHPLHVQQARKLSEIGLHAAAQNLEEVGLGPKL